MKTTTISKKESALLASQYIIEQFIIELGAVKVGKKSSKTSLYSDIVLTFQKSFTFSIQEGDLLLQIMNRQFILRSREDKCSLFRMNSDTYFMVKTGKEIIEILAKDFILVGKNLKKAQKVDMGDDLSFMTSTIRTKSS